MQPHAELPGPVHATSGCPGSRQAKLREMGSSHQLPMCLILSSFRIADFVLAFHIFSDFGIAKATNSFQPHRQVPGPYIPHWLRLYGWIMRKLRSWIPFGRIGVLDRYKYIGFGSVSTICAMWNRSLSTFQLKTRFSEPITSLSRSVIPLLVLLTWRYRSLET